MLGRAKQEGQELITPSAVNTIRSILGLVNRNMFLANDMMSKIEKDVTVKAEKKKALAIRSKRTICEGGILFEGFSNFASISGNQIQNEMKRNPEYHVEMGKSQSK